MKLNTFAPKKSRAQAMVEFAIVLPLLLLLLYGLLEAGRLLFMYSTIVTASRQAARYGSATGQGGDYTAIGGPDNRSLARYQDCFGIRQAAQRVDFLSAFDDVDILIQYDDGQGVPVTTFDGTCDGDSDNGVTPSEDNTTRIVVQIEGDFNPIVPKIVPFIARTVANGNPIRAISARTIIIAVQIEVTPPPGSGGPGPGTNQLQLTMTSDRTTYSFPNDLINFEYTLTNNGTVDLTGISFTQTIGTFVSCDATTLAPGASTTCTGYYYANPADADASGVITIQAVASGLDPTSAIVTSNTGTVTLTYQVLPQLVLTKTASTEYATTNGVVTYTFVVTNTGNVGLTGATVSDPLLGSPVAGCGGDLPTTGSSFTCTASYTITAADVRDESRVNTATASALYGSQTVTSNEASATVYTGPLYLRASVSPGSVSQPADVFYTYEFINNTGTVLYPPYTISGHRGSETCTANTGSIPVGGSISCSGSYPVSQSDLDTKSSLDNSVTVTACTADNNCSGAKKVSSNTDAVTVTLVRTPVLYLGALNATYTSPIAVGTVITYSYPVTNAGNVTLTSSITDTIVTGLSCPGALAPGATQTCTGTYTVTQADYDAGSITNTATATATFNSQSVSSASQSYTIYTFVGPRVNLRITPNPNIYTGVGQYIVYTYTLRNTGSVPLIGPYYVSDSTVTFVDCSTATSPLPVGASTTCVGSYATTQADMDAGHVINSSNITASDGTQAVTSNSAMGVVYVQGAPTLTASPGPTRTPTSTPTATATNPVCAAPPVTLSAGVDSWVDEGNQTATHGSDQLLSVQARNNNAQRALVHFTLPSLPAGCVIQSATLRLYVNNPVSGRTLQAFRLNTNLSWTEAGVNWSNQPAATGTAATVASGTTSGYREWTVTSIVQAMMSSTNNGFVIRDSNEGGGQAVLQQFNSRESATNKPELVITYTQAP